MAVCTVEGRYSRYFILGWRHKQRLEYTEVIFFYETLGGLCLNTPRSEPFFLWLGGSCKVPTLKIFIRNLNSVSIGLPTAK